MAIKIGTFTEISHSYTPAVSPKWATHFPINRL